MKFERVWYFGGKHRDDEYDFIDRYVGENGIEIELIPLDSTHNAYKVVHNNRVRNFAYLAQAKEYVASFGNSVSPVYARNLGGVQ